MVTLKAKKLNPVRPLVSYEVKKGRKSKSKPRKTSCPPVPGVGRRVGLLRGKPGKTSSPLQGKAVKKTSSRGKKGKGSPRKGRYFYAVGRRKRAVARVKLRVGSGKIIVNNKDYKEYFSPFALREIVEEAPKCIGRPSGFDIEIKIKGGGAKGQVEAARHGIARTLVLFEPNFRKRLKRAGFLKRDSRKKERKKPGLKRARRAPQWSKR